MKIIDTNELRFRKIIQLLADNFKKYGRFELQICVMHWNIIKYACVFVKICKIKENVFFDEIKQRDWYLTIPTLTLKYREKSCCKKTFRNIVVHLCQQFLRWCLDIPNLRCRKSMNELKLPRLFTQILIILKLKKIMVKKGKREKNINKILSNKM